MSTQIILIVCILLAFALLGLMMSMSIKKYEAAKSLQKKKKGRSKYLRQSKIPGDK